MSNSPPASARLHKGDRVAFATLGRYPRALCGTVVDPAAVDGAGRARVRIAALGREFLTCPPLIRKIPG